MIQNNSNSSRRIIGGIIGAALVLTISILIFRSIDVSENNKKTAHAAAPLPSQQKITHAENIRESRIDQAPLEESESTNTQDRVLDDTTGYSHAELDFLARHLALIDSQGAQALGAALDELRQATGNLASDSVAEVLVSEAMLAHPNSVMAYLRSIGRNDEDFPGLVATAVRAGWGVTGLDAAEWFGGNKKHAGYTAEVVEGLVTTPGMEAEDIVGLASEFGQFLKDGTAPEVKKEVLQRWVERAVAQDSSATVRQILALSDADERSILIKTSMAEWTVIDSKSAGEFLAENVDSPDYDQLASAYVNGSTSEFDESTLEALIQTISDPEIAVETRRVVQERRKTNLSTDR